MGTGWSAADRTWSAAPGIQKEETLTAQLLEIRPQSGQALRANNDRGDPDAIRIGARYRKVRASMREQIADLDTIGRDLIAKKKALGHKGWLPWLKAHEAELAFGQRAARYLMAGSKRLAEWLAANRQCAADLTPVQAIEINGWFWGNSRKVVGTLGTGDNEWRTPNEYLALTRTALGGIDLDPATTPKANETVRAARIYTKRDDALLLKHEWHGRVFLNPPYAQPLIKDFVRKMVSEYKKGHVTAGIMLTHNYTDATWFHEAASAADAICFTLGRVLFYKTTGKVSNPTQGQIFLYFGNEIEAFRAEFSKVGLVTRLD
jgi:phage N-6-adenine-methyltransferase